jgi:hypothetical protein
MTEPVPSSDDLGRSVRSIGLDVFLSIPDAETFAVAAREWLASLPGLLAPQEWAEVLRGQKPPFSGRPEPRWPSFDEWKEPFTAWGDIVVAPLKWNGMRIWNRPVKQQTLEWLAQVLADRPVSARIVIERVDANGVELPGGVGVSAEAALGGWWAPGELIPVARLHARDGLMWRAGARVEDADGLVERVVSVARAWAGRPGMLGLFAGVDTGTIHGTALRAGLEPLLHWDQAAVEQEQGRELQGYSWVTLVPGWAAGRLGGAARLAASGAFWRLDEQPGGAVLVQATERVGEYDMAAARRVWEVLAPVLPAGVPARPANLPEDEPWLVVAEDAAARR